MGGSPRANPGPHSSYAAADLDRERVLRAFIASGLLFMLVPGTTLGVMNLIQISSRESAALVSPGWIQAHGHAQVFGWIGSFMLGIGFYAVPPSGYRSSTAKAWIAWALWTTGVAARWIANVPGWEWRVLLPASAIFELVAFAIFVPTVAGHRASVAGTGAPSRAWIACVIAGTSGWIATLVLNVVSTWTMAFAGVSPVVGHAFDQRLLVLLTWGVLAPFIWGFSARWLPILLGLAPLRSWLLLSAVAAGAIGVVATFAGGGSWATALFVAGAGLAILGLRLFERPVHEPRTRGVGAWFPGFVRAAYAWMAIAACLGVAAAQWDTSGGLWGASRHAFTVGFAAAMVFAIGQRMLPGFAGHKVLWSPRLMWAGLSLLMIGCALRVSCEVLAYQGYAPWAWNVLPTSAVIELTAVTAFALNMFCTLWLPRSADHA